jgi:hypothetical protein
MAELVQGGYLFYSGDTVLIASPEDLYYSACWDNNKNAVDGTYTSIGSGLNNTNLIANNCTGGTYNTGTTMLAASACTTYSYSGYTDWYLPSKDELNEMYSLKDEIGGFDSYSNYWSSSQNTPETAWIQYFGNGTQSAFGGKEQLYKVRPIRTMT